MSYYYLAFRRPGKSVEAIIKAPNMSMAILKGERFLSSPLGKVVENGGMFYLG